MDQYIIFFVGSPAEKADLEVADEILEINGESLHNSSHTDVISHIHKVNKKDKMVPSTEIHKSYVNDIWTMDLIDNISPQMVCYCPRNAVSVLLKYFIGLKIIVVE